MHLQQTRLGKGIYVKSRPEDWAVIPRTQKVFRAKQPPAGKEGGARVCMPPEVSDGKDFQTLGQSQQWLALNWNSTGFQKQIKLKEKERKRNKILFLLSLQIWHPFS